MSLAAQLCCCCSAAVAACCSVLLLLLLLLRGCVYPTLGVWENSFRTYNWTRPATKKTWKHNDARPNRQPFAAKLGALLRRRALFACVISHESFCIPCKQTKVGYINARTISAVASKCKQYIIQNTKLFKHVPISLSASPTLLNLLQQGIFNCSKGKFIYYVGEIDAYRVFQERLQTLNWNNHKTCSLPVSLSHVLASCLFCSCKQLWLRLTVRFMCVISVSSSLPFVQRRSAIGICWFLC